MGETWVNCKNCGYRYGSWISKCPQCGAENKKARKTVMGKGRKIAIISGAAIGGVFLVLLVISLWLTNQPNPYVNNAYGFSIAYPTGWIVHENYNSGAYSVVASFSSPDNKELIYLRTKQLEQQETVSSIVEQTKQTNIFNSREKGFTYTLDSTATIGNKNVRLMEFSLRDDQESKGQQVIFSKGSTVFFLTYQTSPEMFESGLTKFRESVASFSLINGATIDDYSPDDRAETTVIKDNTLSEEMTATTNSPANIQVNIGSDSMTGSDEQVRDESQETKVTSGILYSVNKVDVLKYPTIVWSYSEDGYYMEVYLDAENISNVSQALPEKEDIKLVDSKNRRFDALWFNIHSTSRPLQPGLSGELDPVFLVPFDKNTGYALMIEDKRLELGSAENFNADSETSLRLAIEHNDITYCDMARGKTLMGDWSGDESASCIEKFDARQAQ